ncbi:unnamed protein product [Ixodes pacificus]
MRVGSHTDFRCMSSCFALLTTRDHFASINKMTLNITRNEAQWHAAMPFPRRTYLSVRCRRFSLAANQNSQISEAVNSLGTCKDALSRSPTFNICVYIYIYIYIYYI